MTSAFGSNQVAIFLFRRDLRLVDNRGLNAARQRSEQVLPLFVLDPRQLDEHPYRSDPALAFMHRSLQELGETLASDGGSLWIRHGDPVTALETLIRAQGVDAVYLNRDYTPFSRQRDSAIASLCQRLGCAFYAVDDLLLQPPEQGLKADGSPYRVFTPYYRAAAKAPIAMPEPLAAGRWLPDSDAGLSRRALGDLERLGGQGNLTAPAWQGGRREALSLLAAIADLQEYADRRDLPAEAGTARLSAHLKFGTCSVREFYYQVLGQLGEEHGLLRQLYWRDFFTQIAWHFPHVFGAAFDQRLAHLHWPNDPDHFAAWCEGRTGFPIVDAGMRELNQTGYMHNRLRMIVASFLVKDLQIDWRWGERYFARKLTDYDPCVNNGSWQWAASTGCDAQPWFRIFNPWRQQQRFDSAGDYIRRWIPELAEFGGRELLALERGGGTTNYPPPLVDHKAAAEQSKARYREALALASCG